MIKSLLTSAALVATVLTANATDVVLYDNAEGFMVAWGQESPGAQTADECANYQVGDKISVTVTNFDIDIDAYPQIALKDGSWEDIAGGQIVKDMEMPAIVSFEVDETMLTAMQASGWWVSGCAATVTKIVWESAADIDPNILWEGEYVVAGWNNGAKFSANKVKVGDVLEYTITDPGADNAQIIVKGSNWANLIGTAKFNHADMATGTVLVGVTQEMLDNCGNDIFLQGDGNVVITKVYRHEAAFDAENVLAYGNRTLGSNVFVTIPEDAKYINATFSKVPDWLQLCSSSWAEIAQPVNRIYTAEDAPVTYQFDATAELLSAINDKKELVFNGGGTEFLSLSVGDELIVDYDVEKLLIVKDYEGFDLSYSDPMEIPYADTPGLGKTSNIVITYDRIPGLDGSEYSIDLYAIAANGEPVQITSAYIPYGTGYIIIPLNEELAGIISEGGLKLEGSGATITKIYYSEDEEAAGIADVTVDANAPVEYYNLQGIKISADDATNGIFIRRQGGKSVKVAR